MAQDRMVQADLTLRLDQTICRYKGHPYYVSVAGEVYPTVALYRLGSGLTRAAHKVDHRLPEFDDSSPPLGYMHWNNRAYYLKRIPMRYQNQGIKSHNIARTGASGNWFTSLAMENCILGKYFTLESAMYDINYSRDYSYPLHRNIAIGSLDGRNLGLYYKGRLVATRRNSSWDYLPSPDSQVLKKIIDKTGVLQC